MNVYRDFFLGMNSDDWEFFALDFLESLGHSIIQPPSRGPDGGKDGLVSYRGNLYLVSCKHYSHSNRAVGVRDEESIIDRIFQHGALGFIGVYSTMLSNALAERFKQITERGYPCLVYDENTISNYLPQISSSVIQKYGYPKGIRYSLHVDKGEYHPLFCMKCSSDILQENMIRQSLGLVHLNKFHKLDYLYGCKNCLANIPDIGWVELYQALHPEELNKWICLVNNHLLTYQPSLTFYKHKSDFESGIQQRMFPANWGRWLSPSA